jgi:hypothetical protein
VRLAFDTLCNTPIYWCCKPSCTNVMVLSCRHKKICEILKIMQDDKCFGGGGGVGQAPSVDRKGRDRWGGQGLGSSRGGGGGAQGGRQVSRVTFTFVSTLNISYSFGWRDWKRKYIFFKMAARLKYKKKIDRHNGKTLPNVSHLPQPPSFSLVPTFKEKQTSCITR